MEVIAVDNVKCAGCAKLIHDNLAPLSGVEDVAVNIDEGVVTVQGDDLSRSQLADKLREIGYPPREP